MSFRIGSDLIWVGFQLNNESQARMGFLIQKFQLKFYNNFNHIYYSSTGWVGSSSNRSNNDVKLCPVLDGLQKLKIFDFVDIQTQNRCKWMIIQVEYMVTKCYLIYIQTFIFNEIEWLTLAVAHGVKFASGLAFPCVANIDIQIIGLKSMQAIFNYPIIVSRICVWMIHNHEYMTFCSLCNIFTMCVHTDLCGFVASTVLLYMHVAETQI